MYGLLSSGWFDLKISCTCRNETEIFTYNYYKGSWNEGRDEII